MRPRVGRRIGPRQHEPGGYLCIVVRDAPQPARHHPVIGGSRSGLFLVRTSQRDGCGHELVIARKSKRLHSSVLTQSYCGYATYIKQEKTFPGELPCGGFGNAWRLLHGQRSAAGMLWPIRRSASSTPSYEMILRGITNYRAARLAIC